MGRAFALLTQVQPSSITYNSPALPGVIFVVVLGSQPAVLRVIPGPVLRNYSWLVHGDHKNYQRSGIEPGSSAYKSNILPAVLYHYGPQT